MALAAPGMAAADAFEGHPAPPGGAIALDCGDRIGRTAWLVAAAWRKDLGRAQLPAPRDPNHQPRDHGLRSFCSAASSSDRSEVKSRSIPPERPINTWSDPAIPA